MSKEKNKAVAIIDADSLVYESACKGEVRVPEFGAEAVATNLDLAIHNLKTRIGTIMEAARCDEVMMCLSGSKPYWREKVYPKYKHNRKSVVRPKLLGQLIDWLKDNFPHDCRPGIEADDLVGIYGTHPNWMRDRRNIIVSVDKDLNQVQGFHLNPSQIGRAHV